MSSAPHPDNLLPTGVPSEDVSAPLGAAGNRRRRLWERALVAVLFLWVFLLACTPMANMDIWYHLRTGQLIWERGHVPMLDWYTYTDYDQPWIEMHWLCQLILVGLYNLGGGAESHGVDLLVLVKAVCLLGTVAIGWKASGKCLSTWAKTACWFLPIICLASRSIVRPDMVSLLFLAAWLWIVYQLDRRPNLIWWLPVIQIFWTNCQGLFVLGPVVGTAYLIDRGVRQLAKGRWGLETAPLLPRTNHLMVAVLLTGLASFVNPYFEEGVLFPLVLYQKLNFDPAGEHLPVIDYIRQDGFANVFLLSELALSGITLLSFLWLLREKRVNVMGLLLWIAFSYLGWKALRNITLLGVVLAVVLCDNSQRIRKMWLARRDASLQDDRLMAESISLVRSAMTIVSLVFISVLSFHVVTDHRWALNGAGNRFGLGEKEALYMHDAVKFAAQPGFPKRAFVGEYGQASVYFFHNGPERRVFLDGRLEVVTVETQRLYFEILHAMADGTPGWVDILRDGQGNLPVVILDSRNSRPSIEGIMNTPGWRLVFADVTAAVFIDTALAEQLQLPAADLEPLLNPPM
jgi:hypothetical protein